MQVSEVMLLAQQAKLARKQSQASGQRLFAFDLPALETVL